MNNMLFEPRKRSENIPLGHKLTLFGSKNPIFLFDRQVLYESSKDIAYSNDNDSL